MSEDVDRSTRERLHEAIQGTAATDESLPEGAMLKGFVILAEWVAPSGEGWLSRIHGGANGEGLPIWQVQGYLHNALFEPNGFDDRADEDE